MCSVGILGVAAQKVPVPPAYHGLSTFWAYQCIDTMKSSRDQARNWANRPDLPALIDQQMAVIAASGANCVAIDTPYDKEFSPVLQAWVNSARAHHLRIWFRGNFSSWEGWFSYPKGMTAQDLITKTQAFISGNPNLFADNDVFTAAPEAEDGGPFNQVEPAAYPSYRAFLAAETTQTKADFLAIHRHVLSNWDSMNGGLAKRMLDQPTVDKIGGTVTIDHYVSDPAEMGNFIDYFAHKFNAGVVIGEWGTPIPEFNGPQTPTQQAKFVGDLLQQMATHAAQVAGVNYWTLTDGSTSLVQPDMTPLPALAELTRYYRPGVVMGTVRNPSGQIMPGTTVTVDKVYSIRTDAHGNFALLVPSGPATVVVSRRGYQDQTRQVQLAHNQQITLAFTLPRQ